jgi:hypothetical protein
MKMGMKDDYLVLYSNTYHRAFAREGQQGILSRWNDTVSWLPDSLLWQETVNGVTMVGGAAFTHKVSLWTPTNQGPPNLCYCPNCLQQVSMLMLHYGAIHQKDQLATLWKLITKNCFHPARRQQSIFTENSTYLPFLLTGPGPVPLLKSLETIESTVLPASFRS